MANEKTKVIKVSDNVWKLLTQIKLDEDSKSLSDVIKGLIEDRGY